MMEAWPFAKDSILVLCLLCPYQHCTDCVCVIQISGNCTGFYLKSFMLLCDKLASGCGALSQCDEVGLQALALPSLPLYLHPLNWFSVTIKFCFLSAKC